MEHFEALLCGTVSDVFLWPVLGVISSEPIDSQDFGDAYEKQRRNSLKDMKPVATVQLQPMKISA